MWKAGANVEGRVLKRRVSFANGVGFRPRGRPSHPDLAPTREPPLAKIRESFILMAAAIPCPTMPLITA
jgi:hypothetical protein